MNDQMNGMQPQMPSQEQMHQMEQMMQQAVPTITNGVSIMLRGLVVSFPQIPPHVMLTLICQETAAVCAMALSGGDVIQMIKIRQGFKTAFDEGLKKATTMMQQATAQQAPPNMRGN